MEDSNSAAWIFRFLLRLLVVCFAITCLWLFAVRLQTGVPTRSSQWISDLVQIKTRAAKHAGKPKLLVLGGSGTLLGISARQIQLETGVPTVNFGVHAALGINYLLALIERVATPGDTVLLVFEYAIYDDTVNDVLVDYIYSRDPQYLETLPLFLRWKMPLLLTSSRVLEALKARASPPGAWASTDECYSASSAIDEWGDDICNLESKRTPGQVFVVQQQLLLPSYGPGRMTAFESIRKFRQWSRERHIRVLASYPNTIESVFYDDPGWAFFLGRLPSLYKEIDVPVLGSPKDFMYDRKFFLDSPYHLTDRGTRMRTEQLIALLRPYLQPPAGTFADRAVVRPPNSASGEVMATSDVLTSEKP